LLSPDPLQLFLPSRPTMGATLNIDLIRDQSHRSLRQVRYFDPKTVTPRAPTDAVPTDALPKNQNSTINGDEELCMATRMVTLSTKSLLFEYLVPERVGHSVGTGSTSRVLIRTQTRLKSLMGFSCVSTQGDFGRSRTYDIN
jgi:hypothetical protein